jgi:Mor family transcriptional regulator
MTIATVRKPAPAKAQPAEPLFQGQSYHAAPDDFVCDVLALVLELAPGITGEQAAQVDAALRERWGGDRPYIAKRQGEGRSDRNAAIRRDYQRGESIALLCRRYQVSRVTVWRVLGVEVAA